MRRSRSRGGAGAARVLVLSVLVVVAGLLPAPRLRGALAQTPGGATRGPRIQALAPPGSLDVPPEGYAVLVWPAPTSANPDALREIVVHNRSDQSATVAANNSALTITVPLGYLPVPDAACSLEQERMNAAVCNLSGLTMVTFDAADAAHPQPLPQQVSVGNGQSVALSAAPGEPAQLAAVGVVNDAQAFGAQAAPSVDAVWDGTSLVISAPDGYKITFAPNAPYGDQGCIPNDDVPTSVTCPATGRPPRLFHVGTQSLTPPRFPLPPATPPFFSATITSPGTTDVHAAGEPITFSASGNGGELAYIWSFGDGTIAVGPSVQHSYGSTGLYSATLTTIDGEFLGQTSQTRLVSVGVPATTVTYPAGWNLIGVPSGTQLQNVVGSLYTTFPCANVPPPPAPAPGTTPLPTVVPKQSCNGYQQVAPSQTLVAGAGYWAYFSKPTTVTLPFVDGQAGLESRPGVFTMIGNPSFKTAAVRGADVVYVYDPTSGAYRQTETLQPGQGAWAYSAAGATIEMFASPPAPAACMPSQPRPSLAWYQLCPPSSPPARSQARLAFDPAQNEAVLFGGYDFLHERTFNDTWTWDGKSWMLQQPATSPSPRSWPSMAYDDALGQIVLFGGQSVAPDAMGRYVNFDETWTWDGTTWTEQHPAVSPSPRYNAAMAYDAAHGELVLFGGFGEDGVNGGYLADTWTYDGQTWTPVCGAGGTPACGPPPGLGNAMAYDPLHQQIVMFGGSNGDNYTWTWDGSGWTLQQPAQAPPAPQFGTLAFDPSLHAVVFVGSDRPTFGTVGNQVWTWDGSNWARLSPAGAPQPRHDAAVTYDPSSGGLLLFGGAVSLSGAEAPLNDTWVLR